MKYVLMLCGWYPSKIDPLSGDFVQRQAIAIAKQCKVIVLFARKDPAVSTWRNTPVFRRQGNLFEYVYYYPQKQLFDKLWSQWYYMKVLKIFLPQLLKEHGEPSVVHVNVAWKAGLWALYLHSKYRWPFVVTEHSTEYQPAAIDNIRNKGKSRQLITGRLFRNCRLLMPVSFHLGQTITDLYGAMPVKVIPNVVDTSLFYYITRKENKRKRLVHVSSMHEQKNITGLVRVLKALAVGRNDFEAVFVGPANENLRSLVKEKEPAFGNISFTGALPYQNVAAILQEADCLLLFSRYENLPCVILEAFCCGVPVIATRVGGIPEIVDNANGMLVAEGDEAALAKAITVFLDGAVTFDREAIAQQAMKQYNYHTIGKQFVKAYAAVLPGD